MLRKECHVVGPLFEHGSQEALQEVFGEVGVVVQIGKGDLGLDHPELGQVPGRVRILGAERGTEGVDPTECQAIRLDVELARDRQTGRLTEKVGR